MKRTFIGCGIECRVYDIGNGVCYKWYKRKEDTIPAYNNAILAEEAGIGPKVYRLGKHGYTTEIVKTLKDFDSDERYKFNRGDNSCAEMIEKAKIIFGNYVTNDLHTGNIGYKNGKPIMIDFGKASGLQKVYSKQG